VLTFFLWAGYYYIKRRDISAEKNSMGTKMEVHEIYPVLYTLEYYNILVAEIIELKENLLLLSSDRMLIEKLKGIISPPPRDEEMENLIRHLMIYDASQAVSMINPDLARNSLEVFSLVFLYMELHSMESEINRDFSYSRKAFDRIQFNNEEDYNNVCDRIDEIAGNNDFVKVFASRGTESWKIDLKFVIPLILSYTDNPNKGKYCSTLYRFSTVLAKADTIVTEEEKQTLKEIYSAIHSPIPEDKDSTPIKSSIRTESLDNILEELDCLIGIDSVKTEVKTLTNFISVQKKREEQGLKISPISYHCVFTGSPGTGKTTVARLIGRIYKHLGILSEGHLIETDRASLIGEYLGQTAPKVERVVSQALNGVLFIDEAYSLINGKDDPYGREAVAALIKRIEDNRDKLIVIMAGYPDEMKSFIESNPGFESRFNRYIEFPDFLPSELLQIFVKKCKESDYTLSDLSVRKLSDLFFELHECRDKSFGNARLVRNIFEQTLENQANRISKLPSITKEILQTIEPEDIPTV